MRRTGVAPVAAAVSPGGQASRLSPLPFSPWDRRLACPPSGNGIVRRGAALAPFHAMAESEAPEYRVKAAFLYNFALLTEWPTNAFASANAPLVIGVLGTDPFGPGLEQTLRHRKIGPRPVRIARFARVEEVKGCQVLFINPAEAAELPAILAALAGRSILTVGETENFACHGGMIGLVRRADSSIALRINVDAVATANLKLSSKLLRLATLVHTQPADGGAP